MILNLTNPVKRILEQTRTKELPDLKAWKIGVLNVKAYGVRWRAKAKRLVGASFKHHARRSADLKPALDL